MNEILRNILYVEDEKDIQLIAKIALEDIAGFTVKLCSNGKDAIAEAEGFKPDLLLLDLMMPGLDGLQTLKELRKLPTIKKVPAIFMTARIQERDKWDDMNLGIIGIIIKPFDPMTLGASIQKSWLANHG